MKKIIYVDMDGVISDFDNAAKEQGNCKRPDLYVDYRNLELKEHNGNLEFSYAQLLTGRYKPYYNYTTGRLDPFNTSETLKQLLKILNSVRNA